jgi:hypothetical protein
MRTAEKTRSLKLLTDSQRLQVIPELPLFSQPPRFTRGSNYEASADSKSLGRGQSILQMRERIKLKTIQNRRLQHQRTAA